MHDFCGVDLKKFANALEMNGVFTELQPDNNKLHKSLLEKFLQMKLAPPFIQDNALLTEYLTTYLSLSRIQTIANNINVWKPEKFTLKMPFTDLCLQHQPVANQQTDFVFTETNWYNCNNCYIKHSKNKAIQQAGLCLNAISALPSDEHYLEYLDCALGMRVVYCMNVLIILEFYNKHDQNLTTIYAQTKELLDSTLQSLLQLIQDATQPHKQTPPQSFIFTLGQKISANLPWL